MHWVFVITLGMGILLGLRLRVPSVLCASGVVVLACVFLTPLAQWTLLWDVVFTLAVLDALQCGYLAGLMLSCAWSRGKSLQRLAG
jgi:hypothetical protein